MTELTTVEPLLAAQFSGGALAPHENIQRRDGTERPNDDVLPRLALWLADVAEAALTPLEQPEPAEPEQASE
jgi:hypothetical protein